MSRFNMKRDRSRSRSNSSDRDSYERSSKIKTERTDRTRTSSFRGSRGKKIYVSNISFDATYLEVKDEFSTGIDLFEEGKFLPTIRMRDRNSLQAHESITLPFSHVPIVLFVGEVTFVQMLKDENNRFKGCAIISFKDPEMAEEAIQTMNRKEFKGRKLVVKEEDAIPDLKSGGDRKRMREDFDRVSLPITTPVATNTANYNTYGLSLTFLNSLNIELPLISIVFVANLDYTVSESDLRDVFCLAGKIMDIEIFKDKEGKSRGFGVVEYEHPVEAVQAISMLHNQSYRDRLLTVRMDRSDRKRDSKPRLPPGLKSVGMGLGVDGKPLKDIKSLPAANPVSGINTINPINQVNSVLGSMNTSLTNQIAPGVGGLMDPLTSRMNVNPTGSLTGGLNAPGVGMNMGRDFSQSSSYRGGTLGNIIQVSNLPLDYTSESLRKLCWNYGDVRLAEMRSQGTGMVKFRSEADAQRAVEMLDRQPFEGRMLSARAL